MKNKWLFWAGISGFFCVAFGAFTAHALEKTLDVTALTWIDKGLKYQFFHTLSLFALGLFQIANNGSHLTVCQQRQWNVIGASWVMGILLFSGSLYLLAFGFTKNIAYVTPIGGCAFLVGWAVLVYCSIQERKTNE